MKICIKCKENKEICMFSKCKTHKDGLQIYCKECTNNKNKTLYKTNKQQILNNIKKWKNNNLDYDKQYYESNKIIFQKRNKQYYQENKEQFKEWSKQYYLDNKEQIKTDVKKYQTYIKNNSIKYQEKLKYQREYSKNYRTFNPHIHILRNQIKNIKLLLNTDKTQTFIEELKYTPDDFRHHIESQFKDNMTWSNIGNKNENWNIDHKIPITWFNQNTPFHIVNHLFNLQPIWRDENLSKSNKHCSLISKEYYEICKQYIKENKLKYVDIQQQ